MDELFILHTVLLLFLFTVGGSLERLDELFILHTVLLLFLFTVGGSLERSRDHLHFESAVCKSKES
jgi:ABC-type polysaccharide/polyol phosphate export permease